MTTVNRYKIKVLEKTLKILNLFDERGKELTISEINHILGFNKTSTFRILKNLEDADFVEKDPDSQKYKLGVKLYYLGSLAEPHTKLLRITKPFLRQLNRDCDETVHLAILHQGEALYLDKMEGRKVIQVISGIGTKLPSHCSGVGKILLAGLPQEAICRIVEEKGLPAFTDNTITDLEHLKAELAKVNARGYAIDNEEIEEGLKCVAAPVHDSVKRVVAAISISAPKERFDKEVSGFILKVTHTARKISDRVHQQGLNKDYPLY
jgi:DNA-binding IclR family transcriptional regulator